MLSLIQNQLREGSFSSDRSGHGSGARYGFVLPGPIFVTMDPLDRTRLSALLGAAGGGRTHAAAAGDVATTTDASAYDLSVLRRAGARPAVAFSPQFILMPGGRRTCIAALVWQWAGRNERLECLAWSIDDDEAGPRLLGWPAGSWTIFFDTPGRAGGFQPITVSMSADFEMTCSEDPVDQVVQVAGRSNSLGAETIVAAVCRALLYDGRLVLADPGVWEKHLALAPQSERAAELQNEGQVRGPISAEKHVPEHWVNGSPKTGELCKPACDFIEIDPRHKRCSGCGRLRWMRSGSIHTPGGRKTPASING